MKTNIKHLITLFVILLVASEMQAQYGNNGYSNRQQRRNSIPQAQAAPKEEAPKTADQIVDAEMPSIVSALELNPFEEAIMSTTLKKFVQERIELQILKLPADKTREAYEKLIKRQKEELKAGLPPEKYEAYVALQKSGFSKAKKDLKKEERKKRKKKKKSKE